VAGFCAETGRIALCLPIQRGVAQPAEGMSVSGKGLCSMELASQFHTDGNLTCHL